MEQWASEDQWVDERKIHVLALFCFLSKWAAQYSTSRWGSCWESQISCPITCIPLNPEMATGARAFVRYVVRQGCMRGLYPRQAETAAGGKCPGVLIKQVAKAWRTSGVQWDGEMQKWVCWTSLGLVYPQAVISSFPTVLKNETTPSNMRLSWKLLWFQLTLPIRGDLPSHLLWNFLLEIYFIHLQ